MRSLEASLPAWIKITQRINQALDEGPQPVKTLRQVTGANSRDFQWALGILKSTRQIAQSGRIVYQRRERPKHSQSQVTAHR